MTTLETIDSNSPSKPLHHPTNTIDDTASVQSTNSFFSRSSRTSISITSVSSKTSSTSSLSCNPRSKKQKHGSNALYTALSTPNWSDVARLASAKPHKAESWHTLPRFYPPSQSATVLPLHLACTLRPPRSAVLPLVQAYPVATTAKESVFGRVPLHIACHSGCGVDCIRVLVHTTPSAQYEQDLLGRVPLHYALSRCRPSSDDDDEQREIVRELLSTAAETDGRKGLLHTAGVSDSKGWLPLHVACQVGASVDVVRMLVRAFPDGVERRTGKGSTPLMLVGKRKGVGEEERRLLEEVLSLGGGGGDDSSGPVLEDFVPLVVVGGNNQNSHQNEEEDDDDEEDRSTNRTQTQTQTQTDPTGTPHPPTTIKQDGRILDDDVSCMSSSVMMMMVGGGNSCRSQTPPPQPPAYSSSRVREIKERLRSIEGRSKTIRAVDDGEGESCDEGCDEGEGKGGEV